MARSAKLLKTIDRDEDLKALLDAMKEGPRVERLHEEPVGGVVHILRLIAGCSSPAEFAEMGDLTEKEIIDLEGGRQELDLGSLTKLSDAVGLRRAHLALILELAEALPPPHD